MTWSGPKSLRPGITLMELLVVLVIVVGMFVAMISVTAVVGQANLRGEAQRIASTVEYVYGRAAINGTRYQLVLDLDNNTFRAECTDEAMALAQDMADGTVGEDRTTTSNRYDDDDDEADPFGLDLQDAWDDCSDALVNERTLRDGIQLVKVHTTHQRDPYEEGQATIGFFPNGFVEPSIIWISEKSSDEAGMTLFIEPMTGSVRIEAGLAEVPSDFHDIEEDR